MKKKLAKHKLNVIWFNLKERCFDVYTLAFPVFLIMGVVVLSARFWSWVVGW